MVRERIEIHLADGSTDLLKDESSINEVKRRIGKYLEQYKANYVIANQVGGYLCEDGKYTVENSLVITITTLVVDDKDIDEFIEYFKKEYKQESVLVCRKHVDVNVIG